MAIKEFNVDLDIKGRVLASTVPNSTGSIVTWNTTTNVFGLRTNTQIISDLNLSSNFVPYTGATANVNLGTRSITSTGGFIGNATTATTLATARTINGTSFNGSANITTTNWGTSRNITIGNTTKSVNGSGNYSWSLAEIGAAAASHTHTFASLTSKPTTIGGYGITDFNSLGDARWALRTRSITGTGGLSGGGNLTANRTIDLSTTTKSDIAKGVTAHGWGNHGIQGYIKQTDIDDSIDDIEIGGRNLLVDSHFYSGSIQNAGSYVQTDHNSLDSIENGIAIFTVHNSRSANRLEKSISGLTVGKVYTFATKSTIENGSYKSLAGVTSIKTSKNEIETGYFIHSLTFIANSTSVLIRDYFSTSLANGDKFELHWAILQEGNKHTGWAPAPEDQVTDWNESNPDSFSFLKNKPTKLTDFTNDAGYITSSSLPTVNNGQLSLSTGSGLSGSANFTANQSGNSSFSVAVASTHKLPTTTEWNALSTQTLSSSTSNIISGNTVQRAALTGDVTASQNSNATTIANSAVTHAKYQNIATQRILGRGATGNGNVQELTLGSNLSLSTAGVLSATNTNTTYSEITVAESNSLTSTIGRLITGRRLNSWGNSKYLPLTGGTMIGAISMVKSGQAGTNTRFLTLRDTDYSANQGRVDIAMLATDDDTATNRGAVISMRRTNSLGTLHFEVANNNLLSLIGHSQNVGVSVETPTEKLDVNGNIRVRALTSSGFVKSSANGTLSVDTNNYALASAIPNVTGFIPYTGANSTVNLNTQSLLLNGLVTKNNQTFETYRYRTGTSTSNHLRRYYNAASFLGVNSAPGVVVVTIPITSSTMWNAQISIQEYFSSVSYSATRRTTLIVGAYTTNNAARFVSVDNADRIAKVEFGKDSSNRTVVLIHMSSSSMPYPKIVIDWVQAAHNYSSGLEDKTQYDISTIATADIPTLGLTINGEITNANFQRDSYYLNYNNFTNTPTIPTVNNGQLSLSTGTGLSGSATFTANQSGSSSFSVAVASTHKLPTTAEWNALSTQTLSNSTSNLIVSNTVQRAALTGDVTASQNSNATTITNSAVTHAKYQNIATQRILGRGATGSGNVQELTLGSNLSLSTAGVLSATNTNTTYSEITAEESNSLTSSTGRLITGRRLNSWGNSKYLPLTGGTLEDGATPLFLKRDAPQVSLGFEVGVTRRFLGINAIGDLIFGNDANINSTGNVVWHKGNLANGTTSQYIRGDGSLATYANTTYSAGTLALLNAGTDTTNRVWGAKPIADYVKQYAGENLGLQGVTERGNWTTNNIEVRLGNTSQQQDLILMPSGSSSNPAGNAALISTGDKGFRISALRSPYLGTMSTAIVSRFGMFYPSSGGTGKSASAFTIGDGSDWAFTYMTNTSGTGIGNGNKSMNINLGYTKHHSERMSKNPTLTGFSRVQSLEFPPESGTLATREWMASPGNEPPSSEPGVSLIRAGEIARYLFRNNFTINHSTKIIDAVDTTYSTHSLAQLRSGTNTSNRLTNPSFINTFVKEEVLPKRRVMSSSGNIDGNDNGVTVIVTANIGMSIYIGTTYTEYYIVNHTGGNRPIYRGGSLTTINVYGTDVSGTCHIKPWGTAIVIWLNPTTVLLKGDVGTGTS